MKEVQQEVKEKVANSLIAALGLVVGLAWNDAVKALIEHFFPLEGSGVGLKFLYALILTVVVVFATIHLFKFFGKKETNV